MNEKKEKNPLEELYVDKDKIDQERLSEVLKDKIGIDQDTGDPYFFGKFEKLNKKRKIICYLLYRKAAVALNKISSEEEGVESREISNETGVNYQTVRSWLSKIDFIEKKDEKSGYHIPNYYLEKATEVLENGE